MPYSSSVILFHPFPRECVFGEPLANNGLPRRLLRRERVLPNRCLVMVLLRIFAAETCAWRAVG
jgi:hypothetical protein